MRKFIWCLAIGLLSVCWSNPRCEILVSDNGSVQAFAADHSNRGCHITRRVDTLLVVVPPIDSTHR